MKLSIFYCGLYGEKAILVKLLSLDA